VSSIRLHDAAEAEYLEAIGWYTGQNPEAARRFQAAVGVAVAALLDNPAQWPLALGVPKSLNVRRIRVTDFPYSVVFVALETETVVVAVAHGKRRPGYWRDRLATAEQSEDR
jgi:plasmid stabilization system protein ParE